VKRVQQGDLHDVGAIPVARHVEVETPAKGSKTTIESSDAAYDQHLDEQLFTTEALERGKP
jgi:hypothetical protein